MKALKRMYKNSSLKVKLIIAFASFIIVPFIIIGGTLSWLYIDSNKKLIFDAAEKDHQQIIKNIETSLNSIHRLTMYPLHDQEIFKILRKDYSELDYPGYERSNDFDTVNGIIQNNILLYSDIMQSVILYHIEDNSVIGRSDTEYIDYTYLKEDYFQESFIQDILRNKGHYVTVGVHREKLLDKRKRYVVSVGRSIIDPYSSEDVGIILVNINIERLKELWSKISFTEHTRFYLIDDKNNLIYSPNQEEIGQSAESILSETIEITNKEEKITFNGKDAYMITSSSELSGWKAVTIIPYDELFHFIYTILKIILIIILVGLLLSIMVAIYIATSITKPLSDLEKKMKQVSEGDLQVEIDVTGGDIGKISKTIDGMLREIRRLISRIYDEEQEKRTMEILALQSQIRPHFIYNTINVIRFMAKMQGAKGIEDALTSFSSVIKFTAKTKGDFVTVREEIEFIKAYTEILDLRYFNKFEVEYDISDHVLDCKTLKFLLQPLIENAVFHGFDEIDHKGKLSIQVYTEDECLLFVVKDNGRGMGEQELVENGSSEKLNSIGISNIRKRIELHFGKPFGLFIESEKKIGTTAKIVLPIIEKEN